MSDPFADLFPRRRARPPGREGAPESERPPAQEPPASRQGSRDAFVDHARRVLLARWGTALTSRAAPMPEGRHREFPLVSGNGRIVGDVAWLEGMASPDWRAAALSERVWVVSHVTAADRRFVLTGHDLDLVMRWVSGHRGMFGGVEVWFLDDERLERLA